MKISERYIYPPRPTNGAIPPSELSAFREMSWEGQIKFNDKRLLISVSPQGIKLYNRHNGPHKTYRAPDWLLEEIREACEILGLDKDEWQYLDGGLLHGKNRIFSDTIVLWDILVRDGEWLLGSTYADRHHKLVEACAEPFKMEIGDQTFVLGVKLTEHIFIPLLFEDPQKAWDLTQQVNDAAGWKGDGEPALEGVLLKRAKGELEPGLTERNNTGWQQRCRVRTGRHKY